VVEKLGVGQGGSSDFSAGARDIARGKDRIEDEKYEVKPIPTKTNFSITSGIHHEKMLFVDWSRLVLRKYRKRRALGPRWVQFAAYLWVGAGVF
jgi:hypothetical protein